MAWRDSRAYRRRLLLFLSCIVLGVSALVAIRSLGDNLEAAVNAESRTLLGADLEIESRAAFDEDVEGLFTWLGGDQSREVRFASMVYFPKNGGTRLVEVRALTGAFPYYGKLVTEPADAADRYQEDGEVLLDDGLMLQFGVDVGDSVRVGTLSFRIAGRLKKVPGQALAVMTVAPRVYLPMPDLEATGLIRDGSLATYAVYFKFPGTTRMSFVEREVRPYRGTHRIRYETVASRQRSLGRAIGNLYRFLNLAGFAALLLGCVGVSSAVHVYVRQKLSTIAVLRCLGAQSTQAFGIYLLQAGAMGVIGSALGALLGLAVQVVLPEVLSQFLPVDVEVSVSWKAVVEGIVIGLGLTLLFALLPLLGIRKISPLRTLRASFEEEKTKADPLRIGVAGLIVLLVGGVAIAQSGDLYLGVTVAAGFCVSFGLLAGVALGLMALVKRYFPTSWRYVWRQGLANLYRPNNQTTILMLSLGLGTFLIITLYLSQHSLLQQVSLAGGGDRPNLVLFDVQTDQVEEVVKTVNSFGLSVMHRAPVVTMRLSSLKGRPISSFRPSEGRGGRRGEGRGGDGRRGGGNRGVARWAIFREYRATYRDHLFDSERIVSGTWVGSAVEGAAAPISLEEGIVEGLQISLGDTLVFDVQGVPVVTVLASSRAVDWQRVQPNFLLVFPAGVLEPAPQFHVFTTRVESTNQSASLQRTLVEQFPNVSVVDLGMILESLDEVLSQVSFVIRFMAMFSILTGLIVLASAVMTSRYQRVQEGVLLRTLGASRRQIVQILFLEYLFLGSLAALTGLVLSIGGGWLLATFVFEVTFAVPVGETAAVVFLVAALTVGMGMWNSRGIAGRPPLEILRAEG